MPEYPRNLRNVALYLRKSRADWEAESRGEGETLSRHRSALLALTQKHDYQVTDMYEEIVSGERILDRPEMQKLLHAVESKRYSAVLCMDLDRLGRGNMVDQGIIQETFKAANTLIITPRKVYDLQDELDEEWSEFEAFMARRELKIITRRLQRGRVQSASLGKSISRKPPYGYLRDRSLKLYPDPQTAPVVQMIFQMAAGGSGVTKISKHLSSLGIPTPTGKSVWDRSSVYAILKNPVYLGNIVWGQLRYQKSKDGRARYTRVRQAKENWVIAEGAHEPLVNHETYLQYQTTLGQHPKVRVERKLVNPLASLLYCGECGKAMRRQQTYNRPHHRLLCPTPGCQTKSSSFEVVEQRIMEELKSLMGGLKVQLLAESLINRGAEVNTRLFMEHRLEELSQQLLAWEEQRNTLHDLLESKIYDTATFLERSALLSDRMRQARQEQWRLQEQLAELEAALPPQTALPQAANVIESYGLAADPELKNQLLKSLIQKILFKRPQSAKQPDEFELEIFLRF